MKTRNFLIAFIALFTGLWCVEAFMLNPLEGALPLVIRKHGIYITGLLSMVLMSLVMVLSVRPAWLEDFIGGMDKIYRLHKWAGIWAIIFAISHWLIKLSGGIVKELAGDGARPGRDAVLSFMTSYRHLAKDLGEWTVYFLIIALAITLIKLIPYRFWHKLHKPMPYVYLILVFHAVALTPLTWWYGLTGLTLAIMLVAGTVSSIMVILHKIGFKKRHYAKITEVESLSHDVFKVACDAGPDWNGHVPGQFAFLKFEDDEGYHPFTIASAPIKNSSVVEFKIKALGDYTNTLKDKLFVGQTMLIEGPYGRLDHTQCNENAKQIWIAAGIGVTPFLSWLKQMYNGKPSNTPIEFHYCVKDGASDPFLANIENMVADLDNVDLIVHDQSQNQLLNVEDFKNSFKSKSKLAEVWFCGPSGLAHALRSGFKKLKLRNVTMHQEAFEMR